MKIYTRTGDKGSTGLFGGDRVSKDHARIEAYGTVDEANSMIGVARAAFPATGWEKADTILHRVQSELFVLGADLATPSDAKIQVPRIDAAHIDALEKNIDLLESELSPLKSFVLPGGATAAAAMHVARTVCRRAERRAVTLQEIDAINRNAVVYLNRLSDLLFVMARWLNLKAGCFRRSMACFVGLNFTSVGLNFTSQNPILALASVLKLQTLAKKRFLDKKRIAPALKLNCI